MRKVKANLEIPEDAYLALSSSGYTKKRISTVRCYSYFWGIWGREKPRL